jgi:hypothetical protein
VEDLRKEVTALRAEIELLKAATGLTRTSETSLPAPEAPRMEYAAVRELSPPAPAASPAASWTVSGFAKLDATHDRTTTAPNDFYTNLPQQPLSGSNAPRSTTRFTAQSSPIALDGMTHINGQPLRARVKTDFYAYGNTALQNHLRLRRAYEEYGNWMLEINASTFVDIGALPEPLDLNGPIGSSSAREGHVQYLWAGDNGLSFTLVAEDPEADACIPNLIARLDKTIPGGSFSLRYMAHEKPCRRGRPGAFSARTRCRAVNQLQAQQRPPVERAIQPIWKVISITGWVPMASSTRRRAYCSTAGMV